MTLATIYERFPTEADCVAYLERKRWPNNKPICPRCGLACSTPLPKELRHHCNRCPFTYSVTVGTVFQGSHLPLRKWLLALAIIIEADRGRPNGRGLARELGINKNTACKLIDRIADAFKDPGQADLLKALIADLDPEHPLVTLKLLPDTQPYRRNTP